MRYHYFFITVNLVLNSPSFTQQYSADAKRGKLKVPSGSFCHGNNGIAVNKSDPNLVGQKQHYTNPLN